MLSLSLRAADAGRRYGSEKKKRYLLEEIYTRICKLYRELLYCQSFLGSVVDLRQVVAELQLCTDDYHEVLRSFQVRAERPGYPTARAATIQQISGKAPAFPSGLSLRKWIRENHANRSSS